MNTRFQTCLLPCIAVAVALTTLLGAPVHSAIVHKYNFNDGTANDSIGTANGTLIGTANIGVDGMLNLTGGGAGNSYVDLPDGIASAASSGGVSGQITAEAWVDINANTNWSVIFSFGNSGPDAEDNNGNDGDYWQLIPQNGANGILRTTTHSATEAAEIGVDDTVNGTALTAGTLQHVVNVLNVGANTNELYVNGVLVGTGNIQPNFDPNTYGTVGDTQNWLGRSQWGDPSLDGSYDEFRIYDHALNQSEVTTSFNEGPDPSTSLTLVVNTTTGFTSIRNDASNDLDFGYYEIASAGGALDTVGWNSLDDQGIDAVDGADLDSIVGNGEGETWDEAGGSSDTILAELFLQGQSTLSPNESISLGGAFDPSVFGTDNDGDLFFSFAATGAELVRGVVEYATGGLAGDFDGDGDVDGADFLRWQRTDGTPAGLLDWQNNYGIGAGSASATAAVPEPSAILLLAFSAFLLVFTHHRRRVVAVVLAPTVAVVVFSASANDGYAAVTLDRDYELGDNPSESAVVGQVVGNATAFGVLDSAGASGAGNFQDLTQTIGDPLYIDVSTRPLAGGSSLGAIFDGDDYLLRPNDSTATQVFSRGGLGFPGNNLPQNPYDNYLEIFTRGIHAWVNPTNNGSAVRQDIVNDTYQFGLHISDTDTWSMTWGSGGGQTVGRVIESSEAVAFNTWSHVHQHSFGAGGVVLYVNGLAVATSGFNGAEFYQPHAAGADLGLTVGASLDGSANFFTGTIDNVEIYVAGDNTDVDPLADRGDGDPIPQPGMDYGTFDLATDNEFIAGELAGNPQGDINLDGSVDNTDVNTFVTNWLTNPKVINNIAVGDLDSYAAGDLDFSGAVDIDDAFLLHEGLQLAGVAAGLDFSLLAGVPEPGTLGLLALGVCFGIGTQRNR